MFLNTSEGMVGYVADECSPTCVSAFFPKWQRHVCQTDFLESYLPISCVFDFLLFSLAPVIELLPLPFSGGTQLIINDCSNGGPRERLLDFIWQPSGCECCSRSCDMINPYSTPSLDGGHTHCFLYHLQMTWTSICFTEITMS